MVASDVISLMLVIIAVAGVASLVRGFRRSQRAEPGTVEHDRARATIWASSGVLCVVASMSLSVLVGRGSTRILVITWPLLGVAVWTFVKSARLRRPPQT